MDSLYYISTMPQMVWNVFAEYMKTDHNPLWDKMNVLVISHRIHLISPSCHWQVPVSWLEPYNFSGGSEGCALYPLPLPQTQTPPKTHLFLSAHLRPSPSLYSWMSKAAAATYLVLWLTALLLNALHCICAVFIASFTFTVIESLPYAKYAPSKGRVWVCVCPENL